MKPSLALLTIALAGCAGTPQTPAPAGSAGTAVTARSAPPSWPAPSRVDCPMVRAIDGRAECVSPARLAARRTAPASPTPAFAGSSPEPAAGGDFVVIGSFLDRANAERWAAANDEFGTDIVLVPGRKPLYRVVVGPLDPQDSAGLMDDILRSIGLGDSWEVALCADARGAACEPRYAPAGAAGLTEIADL